MGVVGYCYGAGPALKLATGDAVDAFAIAHGGGIKVRIQSRKLCSAVMECRGTAATCTVAITYGVLYHTVS